MSRSSQIHRLAVDEVTAGELVCQLASARHYDFSPGILFDFSFSNDTLYFIYQ
jgi:hypothetical protein